MNSPARLRFRLAILLALSPAAASAAIIPKSSVDIQNGGEIVSIYDNAAGNDLVLVTDSTSVVPNHDIRIYDVNSQGQLSFARSVDLDGTTFSGAGIANISSVAADPLGRDFGVASIIPTINTASPVAGKLAFFQLSTGTVLRTVDVGFHPDSVSFSADGARVLVANEGEYNNGVAAGSVNTTAQEGVALMGSVSIVNLAGIAAATDLSAINPPVVNVDFSDANLANGASRSGLRYNVTGITAGQQPLHIEPEYIASSADKAFVTLQENNAIAVVDLTGPNAGKVTGIHPLGTITQTVDASDRDVSNSPAVGKIEINDTVPGLPMPDTVVRFSKGGHNYLVTANEGDARTDDGDVARAGTGGLVDTVNDGGGDQFFAGSLNNVTGLGRLNISRVDGNTDADAGIEVPTMFGTRSVTIWDEDGNKVFDTGSALERAVATLFPETFNINSGNEANFDTRSDDKGPEPEALAFGEVDGRQYLFIGAERQNAIFQFDITDLDLAAPLNLGSVDPLNLLVGYFNILGGRNGQVDPIAQSLVSPESIQFLPASSSPSGKALLVVGYEGVSPTISGSVGVFEVNTLTSVPEPSTWAAALGLGSMFGWALWRRARRS